MPDEPRFRHRRARYLLFLFAAWTMAAVTRHVDDGRVATLVPDYHAISTDDDYPAKEPWSVTIDRNGFRGPRRDDRFVDTCCHLSDQGTRAQAIYVRDTMTRAGGIGAPGS